MTDVVDGCEVRDADAQQRCLLAARAGVRVDAEVRAQDGEAVKKLNAMPYERKTGCYMTSVTVVLAIELSDTCK